MAPLFPVSFVVAPVDGSGWLEAMYLSKDSGWPMTQSWNDRNSLTHAEPLRGIRLALYPKGCWQGLAAGRAHSSFVPSARMKHPKAATKLCPHGPSLSSDTQGQESAASTLYSISFGWRVRGWGRGRVSHGFSPEAGALRKARKPGEMGLPPACPVIRLHLHVPSLPPSYTSARKKGGAQVRCVWGICS